MDLFLVLIPQWLGSQAIQQVNSQGHPPSIPLPCNHPQADKKILPPVSGISQSTTPNMTGQSPSLHHYFYQQQHQNVLESSQFQPSQQSVPHPTMLQPSSHSTLKQNQQTIVPQSGQPVSKQSVLSQQRQQPNATNQHIGQPRNVQQPHQHSNFSSIHQQHSGHMLQSTQGQRSQMSQLQTQSAQLQNQLNVKQNLPTSAAFQSQNVIDQQKQQFQQRRAMPEASSSKLYIHTNM